MHITDPTIKAPRASFRNFQAKLSSQSSVSAWVHLPPPSCMVASTRPTYLLNPSLDHLIGTPWTFWDRRWPPPKQNRAPMARFLLGCTNFPPRIRSTQCGLLTLSLPPSIGSPWTSSHRH